MPNVHLASPGVRQLSASSAACWSTISPATGIVGPKTSVLPTIWSLPTISGSASPVSPNRPSSSSSHVDRVQRDQQRPAGRRGVGDERAAQPVHQPGVGGGDHAGRGHVRPDPRHLRRGEVRVEHQTGALRDGVRRRRQRRADRLGPAVLPHHRGRQRAPGVAVPGQHGFALVGQGHGRHRNAGLRQGLSPGVDDRVEQRLGVLLDAAARQILRPHRDLGDRHDPPGLVDHDGLGARRALVDRQDVLHRHALLRPPRAPVRHRSNAYPAWSSRACRG